MPASGVPLAPLLVAALLSSTGVTLAQATWDATLQRHIPQESLSRVSAYDWFGSLALAPLGLGIWGPISSATGLHAALWLAFGLQAAAAAALFLVPEARRLPAEPAER